MFAAPFFVAIVVLSLFLSPWAKQRKLEYERQLESRDEIALITPGLFREFRRANLVVFVESINTLDGTIRNVFLHSVDEKKDATTVAARGALEVAENGDRFIVLDDGRRYEGKPGTAEYRIVEFGRLGRRIEPAEVRALPSSTKAIPTATLLVLDGRVERAELFWRISVPIAAIVLTLLAVPLAYVNPRIGRSFNLIAAVFLYMLYSNCLNIVQSFIAQGKLDFWVGLVIPHAIAIGLVFLLYRHQLSLFGLFTAPARREATVGRRMKTLTRYIGREVLIAILLIFAALVMLFAFFDLIHELGNVGRGGYTISAALLFVALQLPSRMYELFPVSALIGTLFALAQLVANSEYTVMRVSGASLLQVGWSLLRIGIPLAALTFLAGEFVAPPAERLAQTVRAAGQSGGGRVVAQQFKSGFWFKQDLTFVNIRSVLADLSILGISIYEFDRDLRLNSVRTAESGTFTGNGHWDLKSVRTTEIALTARTSRRRRRYRWDSVLRPSILTVYQVAPERLEINALYENMRALGQRAEDVALRDRLLEQGVLSARRARDDDRCAAVLAFPEAAGWHRLSDLRRNDARPHVLPDRPALLEPRRAQRLAAAVFRGVPARRVYGRCDGDAVVDRAALVRSNRPIKQKARIAGLCLERCRTFYDCAAGSTFAYLCCCAPFVRNLTVPSTSTAAPRRIHASLRTGNARRWPQD